MHYALISMFCITTVLAQADETRTVQCADGGTVALSLRVATTDAHRLTVVAFPDPVQDVISSWNEKDISVEHLGAKLFLKLLSKVEGHLDVVTRRGFHVRLYIKPADENARYDSHIVVSANNQELIGPRRFPEALELVKAMRLGVVPPGIAASRADCVLHTSGEMEVRLIYVYAATRYRGYVLRLTNTSRTDPLQLDPSRFTSPRLVLMGAKSLTVLPEASTLAYLVFWK